MAWNVPKTWANGTVVTDTDLNLHVRDQLRYLKGLDGVVAIQNAISADSAAITGAVTAGSATIYGGVSVNVGGAAPAAGEIKAQLVSATAINVGSVIGAIPGEIKATHGSFTGNLYGQGNSGFGATPLAGVQVYVKGASSSSANYGLIVHNGSGVNNFYIRDDGVGYLKAASWTYGSDARLKKNVKKYNKAKSQLTQLAAIEIEQFDYNDGATGQIGYVAQQLREAVPDAVSETPDGTLTVRSLEPWIILWMQLLLAQNEAQAQQIAALESRLATLESRLATLESRLATLEKT